MLDDPGVCLLLIAGLLYWLLSMWD